MAEEVCCTVCDELWCGAQVQSRQYNWKLHLHTLRHAILGQLKNPHPGELCGRAHGDASFMQQAYAET